jgi:hypothetical protein
MAITTESNEHSLQADSADFSEIDDERAAGDWGLFQRRCAFVDGSAIIDNHDAAVLKRRFCLAYLGQRAQALGGVYMRLRPSVFTPSFIENLAADNASKRFARYPWLERLIALLQQLDQDQYMTSSLQGNIMSSPRPQHLYVVPTSSNSNSFA